MTDRELLELAAKAAKLPVEFEEGDCNGWYPCGRDDDGDVDNWWNPLKSDGDALRLSVALDLDICRPHAKSEFICVWVDHLGDFVQEVMGKDKCIATRRAIVRAAAEIGKAM